MRPRTYPDSDPVLRRCETRTDDVYCGDVSSKWNVLDDDNLLIEILLRVAFPSTLVCTALVCKRWFHHISDRKFLCHFRKLHPPCLLGYYLYGRFVPMLPQPPRATASGAPRTLLY
ncbi:hypothetical protein QYE76_019256 [Lolium multiflorum]|uniref:F-box domain-containing protein n=1 Tax=Lolium multiflorum TaxID=4521 RepID=A0AAD8R665_LOLMU|nr:hypothetical protein QYE76_019256 [Lolium multiflorum]